MRAQYKKVVVFDLIMGTGIRQGSCLEKKKKDSAMRKETWPNYMNINKYCYKISHSIYMEADKEKCCFTFRKEKRGYFTSIKTGVIPAEGNAIG